MHCRHAADSQHKERGIGFGYQKQAHTPQIPSACRCRHTGESYCETRWGDVVAFVFSPDFERSAGDIKLGMRMWRAC